MPGNFNLNNYLIQKEFATEEEALAYSATHENVLCWVPEEQEEQPVEPTGGEENDT